MAYKIGKKCIKCGACIMNQICPDGAIIERNETFRIDKGKCTDCGICYTQEEYFCPSRAIIKV
ncbi:MAG TPA: ferredoxin [Dehalococcoidales bacterium]|nr:ferredoxin [Dehalococcoidales bacterium]